MFTSYTVFINKDVAGISTARDPWSFSTSAVSKDATLGLAEIGRSVVGRKKTVTHKCTRGHGQTA